jgi:hypothetical protein
MTFEVAACHARVRCCFGSKDLDRDAIIAQETPESEAKASEENGVKAIQICYWRSNEFTSR